MLLGKKYVFILFRTNAKGIQGKLSGDVTLRVVELNQDPMRMWVVKRACVRNDLEH